MVERRINKMVGDFIKSFKEDIKVARFLWQNRSIEHFFKWLASKDSFYFSTFAINC